jgi:hypothetical protein
MTRSFVRTLVKWLRETKSMSEKWDETEQRTTINLQMIDGLPQITRAKIEVR